MPGFVIEYHRSSRDYTVFSFPGSDGHRDALMYRLEREAGREDTDVEIVSITSDSLETVRRTHSRYFFGSERVIA